MCRNSQLQSRKPSLFGWSVAVTMWSIGQNIGSFRDEPLDAALSAARQTTDPVELQKLYSIAQQRLTENVPAAPVYESHVLVAYRNAVKVLIFDTSHNTPIFTTVWLDQEVK